MPDFGLIEDWVCEEQISEKFETDLNRFQIASKGLKEGRTSRVSAGVPGLESLPLVAT